jgi:hypothetical protein
LKKAGIALCAAIGPNGKLIYSRWNKTAWSPWATLDTVVTSAPSCTNAGTGKVLCAARDTTMHMVAYLDSAGSISAAVTVEVLLGSAPSCAARKGSAVLCAGRGTRGDLVSAVYNGNAIWSKADWTVLSPLGRAVYSPVNCVSVGPVAASVICAWIAEGSTVAVNSFVNGAWQGELNIGGTLTNPPTCAHNEYDSNVLCVATGTDGSLSFNLEIGGRSGWIGMGSLTHGYSCAYYASAPVLYAIICGTTDPTTSGFFTEVDTHTNSTGWIRQGTATYIGNPACFELDNAVKPMGQAMCVAVQENGRAASITGP